MTVVTHDRLLLYIDLLSGTPFSFQYSCYGEVLNAKSGVLVYNYSHFTWEPLCTFDVIPTSQNNPSFLR